MENASKALIIAGAILLSILLIGVGMYIYNSSMGNIEGAIGQMESQEIDMFNSQFTSYEGTKVKGSQVKALLGTIISNNTTYEDYPFKLVSVSTTGITGLSTQLSANNDPNTLSQTRSYINTVATYTVVFSTTSGLITGCSITQNSTGAAGGAGGAGGGQS